MLLLLLKFIHESLNGHLWEDQLIEDPLLRKFTQDSINGKVDVEKMFYKLWGKPDHYESLDRKEQERWTADVPFNEETYSIFHTALDQSFAEYKKR